MRFASAWTLFFLGACAASDDITPLPPPPPAPPIVGLDVVPDGSVNLSVGQTLTLLSRLVDPAGGTHAPTSPVSYTSRTPSTVGVSASGVLTGLSTGYSTIVASVFVPGVEFRDSVVANVAVTCPFPVVLSLSPADTSIAVGGRFTPTYSLTACLGTQTLTDEFTWSVTDSDVASVNPKSGEITGLGTGITTIHALGQHFGMTAAINLTVH